MGKTQSPQPVKLIIGFLFKETQIFDQAKVILEKRFGRIDFESQALPFCYTTYYEKEFGKDLQRKFISFKRLISPLDLAVIKVCTNRLERKNSCAGCRLINIDPGYLDLSKFILATTKDYSHRIYLNYGIYAELTLIYQNKSFQPQAWTYPDYRSSEYLKILNQIRENYHEQSK